MEVWDIYDKNRIPTGRTKIRGGKDNDDDLHIVVHVCIFNSKNEMLIQQRQPWKTWPDMWDISASGAALSGETSDRAAERETFEEIGYKIDLSDERPYFTINFKYGFNDFYLVEREIDIHDLKPGPEEVKAVKWASKEEIRQMVREGRFIDYYFLELMFEMRKQRGAIRGDRGVIEPVG